MSARHSDGDLGSLPVLAGLAIIWLFLQATNSRFLSAANLTNLTLQIAAIVVISLGFGLLLHSAVGCLPSGAPVDLWCDPGLKPIWGDHDRLEQVFVNLIDNALRHTPPGTPVRVTATAGQSCRTVEIRISDDGSGIPPAEAAHLFLPYRRGGSGAPGAGLGLSIARGIAEAHGGSLTLEPVRAGACFLVTLPVDPPVAGADGPDEVGTWGAGGISAHD